MVKRREFIKATSLAAVSAAASGLAPSPSVQRAPTLRSTKRAQKVFILGFDGMDPGHVARLRAQGHLPHIGTLMDRGFSGTLRTTMPAQSPVAWSSFTTGTDPGGHGIFDFVHRDPKSITPFLSTSRSSPPTREIEWGEWKVPLRPGSLTLERHGTPFWSALEAHDIPTTLYSLPANFPVVPQGDVKQLSGMGTPDLLGGYGTYTIISEHPVPNSESFTGGRVVIVAPKDHRYDVVLTGPQNPFRTGTHHSDVSLTIHRDPWEDTIKVEVDEHALILKKGEWSDWLPLKFEFIPLFSTVHGMVRILVKQVHPHLTLYLSPINIDPLDPSLPICSPSHYSRELTEAVGRFYTQGLPANTKALEEGSLSNDEYLQQAKIVLEENLKAFHYELDRFDEGCFLFYFSSIDQNSHMLWRCMDPAHPLYDVAASPEVKDGVNYFYRKMDEVLGETLARADSSSTVIALSDHGFGSFTREFHLSTWLLENGYLSLTDPAAQEKTDVYDHVDWPRTKAYALGINGLYLNLRGREKRGVVNPTEGEKLKRELAAKLLEVRDPLNGRRIIRQVYDASEIYHGPYAALAPDLLVGYDSGYRISDEAVLGKFPKGIVGDRTNKWSADHCIDSALVPGVLFSTRQTTTRDPAIWDLAPSILNLFGVPPVSEMTGRTIFEV